MSNAADYLTTPTHDGSGQGCHPSVIDFLREHDMDSWAGYRYWMVMTPFPDANDAHEDPNILASHDGIAWVVPTGMVNPLDDGTGGGAYNSDPDMVYNPDTDELWVYYRYSVPYTLHQRRLIKVSPDMTYTDPQVIKELVDITPADVVDRSLVVWRESSDRWHMWGGGGTAEAPFNIYYFFSTDGVTWSDPAQCLNADDIDPIQALVPNNYLWHFGGKPNYREHRMEFLAEVVPANKLYCMQCYFNNPLIISTPVTAEVLSGSANKWDDSLYRPSFVIEMDFVNNQYIYHVWYTGISVERAYHIGYTSGVIDTGFLGKGWW